jgi:hypothetical protein
MVGVTELWLALSLVIMVVVSIPYVVLRHYSRRVAAGE